MNLYFRSDSWTVNGVTAKQLGTTNSSSSAYITNSSIVNPWFATEFVSIVHADSTETVVFNGLRGTVITYYGDGVLYCTRTSNGSGYQATSTWKCPQITLYRTDALKVMLAVVMNTPSSAVTETFISARLDSDFILSTTWSGNYYTYRTTSGKMVSSATGRIYYGDAGYNSYISGITTMNGPLVSKPIKVYSGLGWDLADANVWTGSEQWDADINYWNGTYWAPVTTKHMCLAKEDDHTYLTTEDNNAIAKE